MAKGNNFQTSQVISVLLISTIGGTITAYLMRRRPTRIIVIIISLFIGLLNTALLICVSLLSSNDTSNVVQSSG